MTCGNVARNGKTKKCSSVINVQVQQNSGYQLLILILINTN